MKTLSDYIKGYPMIPVLLLARYRDKSNNKYYLCKVEGHNNFYYMKGDEVIEAKYIVGDRLEKLSINYINSKSNKEILTELKEQPSYKYFVKFIKEQTGDEYEFDI